MHCIEIEFFLASFVPTETYTTPNIVRLCLGFVEALELENFNLDQRTVI